MTATPRWGAWLIVFAALAGPAAAHGLPAPPSTVADAVQVIGFDPVHTRFGFQLRTRWGHRIDGAFPHHDGALLVLPDGRRQVRIRLATAAVEVDGSARYADIARGERFFDAARYPVIEFLSEPHQAALAHTGASWPEAFRRSIGAAIKDEEDLAHLRPRLAQFIPGMAA